MSLVLNIDNRPPNIISPVSTEDKDDQDDAYILPAVSALAQRDYKPRVFLEKLPERSSTDVLPDEVVVVEW